MKNVYVSPEVELIALAPAEGIAALGHNFDISLGGLMSTANSSVYDVDVNASFFS